MQVAINPTFAACCVPSMQLAGCNQIACAGSGVAKCMPTMKCASAAVVQAHGVKIVHVRSKRMLYPARGHHFKAGYARDS